MQTQTCCRQLLHLFQAAAHLTHKSRILVTKPGPEDAWIIGAYGHEHGITDQFESRVSAQVAEVSDHRVRTRAYLDYHLIAANLRNYHIPNDRVGVARGCENPAMVQFGVTNNRLETIRQNAPRLHMDDHRSVQ